MKKSNIKRKAKTDEMPVESIPENSGNMPTGEMPGETAITTMNRMIITEMPHGDMNGDSGNMSEGMPGGQMTETTNSAVDGVIMNEMPLGDMLGTESQTGGMPGGQMVEAASANMDEMPMTEMPLGDMLSVESYVDQKVGELLSMKITGEWCLTISSVSVTKDA